LKGENKKRKAERLKADSAWRKVQSVKGEEQGAKRWTGTGKTNPCQKSLAE
jgi:hypothetical protein